MKKQILVGMLLSLTLFSCGDKTSGATATAAATANAAEKTSPKTPEEYAALECEYLTKEKEARKAGNNEEKEKFDELGDQLRKEAKITFKDDDLKKKAYMKLVGECRKNLNVQDASSNVSGLK
jgi:uncharacterized protein (DUF488 family)